MINEISTHLLETKIFHSEPSVKQISLNDRSSLSFAENSVSTPSSGYCSRFFCGIGNFFVSIWQFFIWLACCCRSTALDPDAKFKEICNDLPKFFHTIYPHLQFKSPDHSDINFVCPKQNETLLHLLCLYENVKNSPFMQHYGFVVTSQHIKLALKKGADPEICNHQLETALHLIGSKETAELILENRSEKIINSKDALGRTPLFNAGFDASLAGYLIKEGADVTIRDVHNNTPLHFARTVEVAKLLIENDTKSINQANDNGETPLYQAVQAREIELAFYLLEQGASAMMNPKEDSVFFHTLKYLDSNPQKVLELCKLLLQHQADPNVLDNNKNSPLAFCILKFKQATQEKKPFWMEAIKFLLTNTKVNVSINVRYEEIMGQWVEIPLIHFAIECGSKELVEMITKNSGLTLVDDEYKGCSPLKWAVICAEQNPEQSQQYLKIALSLIESGASVKFSMGSSHFHEYLTIKEHLSDDWRKLKEVVWQKITR